MMTRILNWFDMIRAVFAALVFSSEPEPSEDYEDFDGLDGTYRELTEGDVAQFR